MASSQGDRVSNNHNKAAIMFDIAAQGGGSTRDIWRL